MLALSASTFCRAQSAADSTAARPDTLAAQTTEPVKKKKPNIFKRFIKGFTNYDTTYISPNYYNYTAMVQNTNSFQTYRIEAKREDGTWQGIYTKPVPSVKVGPYFGWRWIFLGYTFDVAHPRSAAKTSSFNFSIYSAMLGCDLVYLHNSGDYTLRKATGFDGIEPKSVRGTKFDGLDANTLSFSAYYVINHKHFSYPAAYNQSTVQRKSAGSGIVGFGFSKQSATFDYTRLPDELQSGIVDGLKKANLSYKYYYLSGGYAYNWAFAHNWLLAGSVVPSIGVRKMKGEKVQGREIFRDLINLSFDCTSRVGLVWNNAHWFGGASFISHLYLYNKNGLAFTNSVNFFNIYAGFFFHRKKQYRTKPK